MAEWGDIHKMLDDVFQFAREHPRHQFLWADNMQMASYGITAFIDDPLDEQPKEWTIHVTAFKNTWARRNGDATFVHTAFRSAAGRKALLENLVAAARLVVPEPPVERRSRWEMIMEDDDG